MLKQTVLVHLKFYSTKCCEYWKYNIYAFNYQYIYIITNLKVLFINFLEKRFHSYGQAQKTAMKSYGHKILEEKKMNYLRKQYITLNSRLILSRQATIDQGLLQDICITWLVKCLGFVSCYICFQFCQLWQHSSHIHHVGCIRGVRSFSLMKAYSENVVTLLNWMCVLT